MRPKQIFTLTIGIIACVRSLGYILPEARPEGLAILAQVPGGLSTWGWAWALVGFTAILGAFTKHTVAPLIPAAAIHIVWGGSFLVMWWYSTFIVGEDSRGWLSSASYIGMAVAILVVIRLIDPGEVKALTKEDHE